MYVDVCEYEIYFPRYIGLELESYLHFYRTNRVQKAIFTLLSSTQMFILAHYSTLNIFREQFAHMSQFL